MNRFPAPLIYLAGPILGNTEGEAKNWRARVNDELEHHGIIGISPLRCEPIVGERYEASYGDPCFGTPRAILSKNFLDLRRCDATLAYFPKLPPNEELLALAHHAAGEGKEGTAADLRRLAHKLVGNRSMGTIGEISWAKALNKPLIVVSEDEFITAHPFGQCQPDWLLSSLDEAVRCIVGIYGAYAGGKNV